MTAPGLNPGERIDYSSTTTPSSYVCECCGSVGVKLWRESYAFVDELVLHCADCAAVKSGVHISGMRPDGTYNDKYFGVTNHIGNLFPAVPSQRNDAFWRNYPNTPPAGREWWDRLPVR